MVWYCIKSKRWKIDAILGCLVLLLLKPPVFRWYRHQRCDGSELVLHIGKNLLGITIWNGNANGFAYHFNSLLWYGVLVLSHFLCVFFMLYTHSSVSKIQCNMMGYENLWVSLCGYSLYTIEFCTHKTISQWDEIFISFRYFFLLCRCQYQV